MSYIFKLSIVFLLISGKSYSQQIPDTTYNPPINNPTYEIGKGPVVFIDGGHNNFHTKENRYWAFSNLLERDGYIVESYSGVFDSENLEKAKILVISNAMNEANLGNWTLPTPSAFTDNEIKILNRWVANGGGLFLIADHMPMSGAAKDLAEVFGFNFTNGFAIDTTVQGAARFSLDESTLGENIITKGRNEGETVTEVMSFTGQAFKIPGDAEPILVFNDHFINMLPDTAWRFHDYTRQFSVAGWSQGAYKTFGKGKVVAFGEAAMFTSQLAGPNQVQVGMSSPGAEGNHQLLLNIIHWLDGLIGDQR